MSIDDPDGGSTERADSTSAETAPHAEDETELVEEPIGDEEETGGSDTVAAPASAERSDGDEAPLDSIVDDANEEEQVGSRPGEVPSGDRATPEEAVVSTTDAPAERPAQSGGAQDRTDSTQSAVDDVGEEAGTDETDGDSEAVAEGEPVAEAMPSESSAGEEPRRQQDDAGDRSMSAEPDGPSRRSDDAATTQQPEPPAMQANNGDVYDAGSESARSDNTPDQTRHEWLAKLHEVAQNSSRDDSRGEYTDRTPSPDAGSRPNPPTPPDDPEDFIDLVDGGADLERGVGEQLQSGGQAIQDHSDQITGAVGRTVETAGDRAADAVPSTTAGKVVDEASEAPGDIAEANSDVVAAIGQLIDVWGRLLEAVADMAQSPVVKGSAAVTGTLLTSPEARAKIRDFIDYFDHLGYRGKHRE